MVPFKRLSAKAIEPTRGTKNSAGLDLYACQTETLSIGEMRVLWTDIAMAIPKGWVGIIKDRSSMASKGIYTHGGVIDSDYRGNIGVLLENTSDRECLIPEGARVAQLLIMRCDTPDVIALEDIDFDNTERGTGGFGHTGA